jgi:hypothetical protein
MARFSLDRRLAGRRGVSDAVAHDREGKSWGVGVSDWTINC